MVPGMKKPKHHPNLGTELMLIAGNIPAAIYFAINRTILLERSAYHILTLNILISFVFTASAILIEDATLDINPKTGVFGWMNSNECFVAIFFYGFLATFFGSIGYVISMQFFKPHKVLAAMLLEPICAQILGCVFKIDLMPGWLTIFGIPLIILGMFWVNKGTYIMIKDNRRMLPTDNLMAKEFT